MRRSFLPVKTREEAQAECPWAALFVQVEGGWLCFESVLDYQTWERQR